jgi:hypothetical protein
VKVVPFPEGTRGLRGPPPRSHSGADRSRTSSFDGLTERPCSHARRARPRGGHPEASHDAAPDRA